MKLVLIQASNVAAEIEEGADIQELKVPLMIFPVKHKQCFFIN